MCLFIYSLEKLHSGRRNYYIGTTGVNTFVTMNFTTDFQEKDIVFGKAGFKRTDRRALMEAVEEQGSRIKEIENWKAGVRGYIAGASMIGGAVMGGITLLINKFWN